MHWFVDDLLCSEPSGRRLALLHFATSLAWVGIYLTAWLGGDPRSGWWALVMAAGIAVAGVAEALPEHRRRTAGLLRLVAILGMLCLVAAMIVSPELITG